MKLWKERKEVYIGYLDGVINVYVFSGSMEKLILAVSFQMHDEPVYSIHIIPNLKVGVSSGFDSTLKLWRPPETWSKKFVVTPSMVKGVDPDENLSTIKEEYESINESAALHHRISGFENPYSKNNAVDAMENFGDLLDRD